MADLVDIRQAEDRDAAVLADICLRTSDAGGDGSHLYSDPEYPGLIWVLPYLRFCPEQAFVLEIDGKVTGYCVATRDTALFQQQLEQNWWPRLRTMIAGRTRSTPSDQGILDYIRQPEITPDWLTAQYPAHLHINLLPEAQGSGNGGYLLKHQMRSLQMAGVKGVHLGINQHNTGVMSFYEKHGFKELTRLPSVIMGQKCKEPRLNDAAHH